MIIRLVYPSLIRPASIEILDLPLVEKLYATEIKSGNFKPTYSALNNKKKLFVFDPNTIDKEHLLQLGFKEKTADILIKFRSKGFKFKTKEDLKKVFGVSDKLFSQLKDYIIIQEQFLPGSFNDRKVKTAEKSERIVDINLADSLQFLELKGIGPAFAKRIIKYRSMLGGFAQISQIKEVYGFTEEMFNKIASQITLSKTELHKINLNSAEFKEINNHPYISYELAKEICNKRRKGIIRSDNLSEVISDQETITKLLPYIEFD